MTRKGRVAYIEGRQRGERGEGRGERGEGRGERGGQGSEKLLARSVGGEATALERAGGGTRDALQGHPCREAPHGGLLAHRGDRPYMPLLNEA